MVADQFRLVRQVIGIDTYAVAADQTGTEVLEIPFGASRVQDFHGVEAELIENDGEFVDEGDVEVALRVLDYLGGFGHANRGNAVNAGIYHRRVQVGNLFERFRIVPGHDLHDLRKVMLPVAGIDAFGGVPDVEILAPSHTGLLLEYRHANLFGRPRIDGRLVDDRRARFQMPADRDAGRFEWRKVGLPRRIDRGRNSHDDEVRLLERDRIQGNAQEPRPLQLGGRHFARRVRPAFEILYFLARQVETDCRTALSELDRERKPDIAQADYGNRRRLLAAVGPGFRLKIGSFKELQHGHSSARAP